ncbi:long-chain fatty acid transport protein [Desulfonatronum zhilinae]|nr:long-chain fatty acid transport protein [Desulfonatronum zhilinae]
MARTDDSQRFGITRSRARGGYGGRSLGISKFLALGLVLIMGLLGVGPAYGAGFALYEFGARGTSMGGTMIGRADDPSAVAYNPAGITQLEGTQTMVGFSLVMPEGDIETPGDTTSIKSNTWIPPHAYVTRQMSDRIWLGLGVYNRFGLGTEFPDGWPGEYNNLFTRVKSLSFNPNLAYKLTDSVSVAVGAEVMWFDFYQKRMVGQALGGMRAELEGDSWGVGGNIALHYKPNDTWALGLTYKSRVKQTIKGDATFKRNPAAMALGYFNNTSAEGDLTLPDSFGLGVMFRPIERLSLEANAIYTLWSTYDKLEITYGNALTPGSPMGDNKVSSAQKNWNDVWRFQFGAEYDLTDLIKLRLGYVYDQIPDDDEYADYMTPTNDRNIITTGLGLAWDNLSLDFSYSYLWFGDRSIKGRPADGVLDSTFKDGRTHLIGTSLSYRF